MNSMLNARDLRVVPTLIALLILSACGGGGGSSPTPSTPPPVATYALMGTVSGLTGSGLVLRNNGTEDIPLASDGSFTISAVVPEGEAYDVIVATQPWDPAQTCTVANGSGVIGSTDVTDLLVSCVDAPLQSMIIRRGVAGTQFDLIIVREDGDGVLALANSTDRETFQAIVGDRVIYRRDAAAGADIYSVLLDGTQIIPLATEPEAEIFGGVTNAGVVVFARSGNLYSINMDGTGLLELTNAIEDDRVRKVTPDGRVIFSRIVGRQDNLYAVDFDGNDLVALADTPQNESFIAVTPGGRVIYSRLGGAQEDLFAVVLDGTGLVALADDAAVSDEFVDLLDNEVVLFRRETTPSHYDLFAVRSDGTAQVTLAATSDNELFAGTAPGERVVYLRDAGGQFDLYIINSDGTGRTALAASPTPESFAGVMPDGRAVFIRGDGGAQSDIYSIDLDGTSEIQVTNTPELEFLARKPCPRCSVFPSAVAGRIVFEREIGAQTDLFSINTNGTDERQLTDTPESETVFDVTRIGGVIYRRGVDQLHRVGVDGNGAVSLAATPDSEILVTLLD